MHTTKTKNAVFIHNGDYSGDVLIALPKTAVKSLGGRDEDQVHVSIPFLDLRAFIASYVRDEKRDKVGNANDAEILGIS